MAKVQLANVAVLDNPSPFLNPFQFEVTFECIEELQEGKFHFYLLYYLQSMPIIIEIIMMIELFLVNVNKFFFRS